MLKTVNSDREDLPGAIQDVFMLLAELVEVLLHLLLSLSLHRVRFIEAVHSWEPVHVSNTRNLVQRSSSLLCYLLCLFFSIKTFKGRVVTVELEELLHVIIDLVEVFLRLGLLLNFLIYYSRQ